MQLLTAPRRLPSAAAGTCPVTEDVTVLHARAATRRDAATRERWTQMLAARLDAPMAVLGLVFLLVVLGQDLAKGEALRAAMSVAAWLLWLVFVAEFSLRMYVAPDRSRFLRRNWWQLLFLAVPVLRLLRVAQVLRAARAGRVLSSAVRSSRSAGRVMSTRLGWMASLSAIVALSSSQLLYAFGGYDRYGAALHDAAFATVSGEPLTQQSQLGGVLEIALAAYSVVVFAALAGSLGAYFVAGRPRPDVASDAPVTAPGDAHSPETTLDALAADGGTSWVS